MDSDLILKSLRDVEAELQGLDQRLTELEQLRARREQIYGLVCQMRFVLGLGPYSPEKAGLLSTALEDAATYMAANPNPSPNPPSTSIWESARIILRQANGPLDLPEIVNALRGLNFKLPGRSGKETVRAILNKKPDVFERLGEGKYKRK